MKLTSNIQKISVISILLLAFALRLWQLGEVPPSPDWDEAALGYNAYSILQTGRDEYGELLPVVLESFGDYKPALYTYLIIPLLPIFGLDIIAVRLPSVIAGVLAVWLIYLLLREWTGRLPAKKVKHTVLRKEHVLPLAAAFLLAISPWHIQFSRVAFEANVAVTLNLAMVYFFYRGLQKPKFLSVAALCAALSLYAYQSTKVFVPLLVVTLLVLYLKELLLLPKKYLSLAFIVGIIAASPMVVSLVTNDDALDRARSTNILANQTELLGKSIERLEIARSERDTLGILLNNRRVVIGQEIVKNYLSHFDLNWLFITGDAPRHHAPFMGLLYLWELPFLFIGVYTLVFYRKYLINQKENIVLFAWILLAPLPASITNDVPHAVRTLNFLPTFQIFTAVGILSVISYSYFVLRFNILRFIFYILCLLFITFNLMYFLNQYFVQQNYYFSEDWQYGYKEAVTVAEEKKDEYEKIVVSNQVPMDQSYIFFLYYLKYPPALYQQDQNNNKAFSQYEFRPIEWEKDNKAEDTLFIGTPKDFPEDIEPMYTISYSNGEPAIFFVEPSN